MTRHNDDLEVFRNLHKDAYGFSPSHAAYERVSAMSDVEFGAEMNFLSDYAEAESKRASEAEADAVKALESRLAGMMRDHNISRDTAIRWAREADTGSDPDLEYWLWLNGIPSREFVPLFS